MIRFALTVVLLLRISLNTQAGEPAPKTTSSTGNPVSPSSDHVARTSPTTTGKPRTETPNSVGTGADITPEQAIRAATDLLDQVERGEGEGTWESVTKEIDGYIAIVQSQTPMNPWLAYLYGRVYAIGGRRGDSIEQLQRFVETREGRNEWGAFRLLGDLFVEEFPRLAKANYDKAADLKTGEPSVLYGLSKCAVRMGNLSEAVTLARQAVDADRGQSIRYVSHLARMLLKSKQWDEAERFVLEAVRLAQRQGQNRPGSDRWLRIEDSQYQFLIEILQERLGDDPTADAYVRLIQYMRKRVELEPRMTAYEIVRVLEVGVSRTAPNTSADLLEAYGVALVETGQVAVAADVFRKLSETDPANPIAAEWLSRLPSESPPPNQP